MPPLLQLILSLGFMFSLACLLFGAPFVPPFRSMAINVVLLLTVLGNIFVFFVIFTTVYIYKKSKDDERCNEDNRNAVLADCDVLRDKKDK